MNSLRGAVILMSVWMIVETLTLWAAAFGGGPFVPLVANADGEADAHTRRFAAFLGTLMLLNLYAVLTTRYGKEVKSDYLENNRRRTVVHTVIVANLIAMVLALIIESIYGEMIAILWHVVLILGFGNLLVKGEWSSQKNKE